MGEKMTKIKSLELAQEIYKEAKIEREFIVTPNGLFFTVQNDIAEEFSRHVSFLVADHMFDSFNLESELKTFLVASDPELAKYYRELAESYLDDNTEKYYIATERFRTKSGEERIDFQWLIKRSSIDNVYLYYQEKHDLRKSEILDMFATKYSNGLQLVKVVSIPKDHFDILKKYLSVVN